MRKVAFVCGPYNKLDKHNLSTAHNISVAEECSIWLWNNDYSAFCPHLNTKDFHLLTYVPEREYVNFYLKVLASGFINLLVLLPHWRDSTGSRKESNLARQLSIPRYYWTPNADHLTLAK